MAQSCWQAAIHERADAAAISQCNLAIEDELLSRHDMAGTFINRGVLEMVLGRNEAARGDFDRAIAIEPKLGEAWADRGAVSLGQSRYQDAVKDITKALSLGVDQPEKSYFNRALAYEAMDDEKSAYFDFLQAQTLAPAWELPKKELLRFTVTRQ
jgi:tetratricopeptide (TPR) repeat protein